MGFCCQRGCVRWFTRIFACTRDCFICCCCGHWSCLKKYERPQHEVEAEAGARARAEEPEDWISEANLAEYVHQIDKMDDRGFTVVDEDLETGERVRQLRCDSSEGFVGLDVPKEGLEPVSSSHPRQLSTDDEFSTTADSNPNPEVDVESGVINTTRNGIRLNVLRQSSYKALSDLPESISVLRSTSNSSNISTSSVRESLLDMARMLSVSGVATAVGEAVNTSTSDSTPPVLPTVSNQSSYRHNSGLNEEDSCV